MLFWNMLWALLGVRMVSLLCLSLLHSGTSSLPPPIPSSSNDVFLPTRASTGRCSLWHFVPMLKENYLGWSGIRPLYAVVDKPSSMSAPHCLYGIPLTSSTERPLTPLNKPPLSFQSALSLPSSSLTPSDRSRPHRMRRSNSILRSTPTLRIRLYTPRFTPHAILGSINSIPTYFARGE